MKARTKYLIAILVCIICSVISFFAGRSSSEIKETVKYETGKTVRVDVPKIQLVPYSIKSYSLISYKDPAQKDSSGSAVITSNPIYKDTAIQATLEDWNIKRTYKNTLFKSEYGQLDYSIDVQYNEMQKFSYSYTPIQKVITREKIRTITPFISANYSTLNIGSVGGGLFYHNLGFEVLYQIDFITMEKGYSGGIKIKF